MLWGGSFPQIPGLCFSFLNFPISLWKWMVDPPALSLPIHPDPDIFVVPEVTSCQYYHHHRHIIITIITLGLVNLEYSYLCKIFLGLM